MSLSLATVRYFTQDDPYHYTVDNRPLSDLDANDQVLLGAINQGVTGYSLPADGTLTPDVSSTSLLVMEYTSPVTLTDLTGGVDGQTVTILSGNGNVTLATNSTLTIHGGSLTLTANSSITLKRIPFSSGSVWVETGRAIS